MMLSAPPLKNSPENTAVADPGVVLLHAHILNIFPEVGKVPLFIWFTFDETQGCHL